MLPFCLSRSIAVTPWSPLARGRLARAPEQTTVRLASDGVGKTLYADADADRAVIDSLGTVAAARSIPRAQVALAWLLHKGGVTAPVVGATSAQHLEDAIAALSVKLSSEEIAALEAPYLPHRIAGHG